MTSASFPTLETADLNRRRVVLPDDLAGQVNLVVVAYQREQQEDVDSWAPLLDDLEASFDGFRWHELPVVGERGRPFRLMLDTGMRMGIRDEAVRARVFTLYVDPGWFRAALGLDPDRTDIALTLLDRQRTPSWTAYGPHDPTVERDLRAQLALLLPD